MIKHVTARKQENSNQTERGPYIAISDYWENVGRQHRKQSHNPHQNCKSRNDSSVIYGTDKRRFWPIRELAVDPGVDLVDGYGTNSQELLA